MLPTLFYLRIFETDSSVSERVSWLKKSLLYAIMLVGAVVFAAGVYDGVASAF